MQHALEGGPRSLSKIQREEGAPITQIASTEANQKFLSPLGQKKN
jgi:hypothetical protein